MSIYDELTRTEAPPITSPRRLVINDGIFGRAGREDGESSSYEEQKYDVLRALSHGPRTQKQLAVECEINYRRMSQVLQRMGQEKLVLRLKPERTSAWILRNKLLTNQPKEQT